MLSGAAAVAMTVMGMLLPFMQALACLLTQVVAEVALHRRAPADDDADEQSYRASSLLLVVVVLSLTVTLLWTPR